jgi:hypothetical protein
METDADVIIKRILHAQDDFLIEIGRLTLLFSHIEDALATDARLMAAMTGDTQLQSEAESPLFLQRVLDKRDFVKKVVAEVARYYGADASQLLRTLDELGNLQRLRRTVVHGWIRWSAAEEAPVFVDSRGATQSAWPWDVLAVSSKVIDWHMRLRDEQSAFVDQIRRALAACFDTVCSHKGCPPNVQKRLAELRARLNKTH